MKIVCSEEKDFDAWISLAREVEPLFGPMADEISFHEALRQAISLNTAFCIYLKNNGEIKKYLIVDFLMD